MGGIYIGKYNEASQNKVRTFIIRDSDLRHYYATRFYRFRTADSKASKIMFKSAPELLAFWSEDD